MNMAVPETGDQVAARCIKTRCRLGVDLGPDRGDHPVADQNRLAGGERARFHVDDGHAGQHDLGLCPCRDRDDNGQDKCPQDRKRVFHYSDTPMMRFPSSSSAAPGRACRGVATPGSVRPAESMFVCRAASFWTHSEPARRRAAATEHGTRSRDRHLAPFGLRQIAKGSRACCPGPAAMAFSLTRGRGIGSVLVDQGRSV